MVCSFPTNKPCAHNAKVVITKATLNLQPPPAVEFIVNHHPAGSCFAAVFAGHQKSSNPYPTLDRETCAAAWNTTTCIHTRDTP
jgi:hypothetical protein